jgi:thiamine pyrophosphokinase
MRTLIALNGRILDLAACGRIARTCGRKICADGGARHLRALDLTPDLLVGDLDSIDADSLAWMESRGVLIRRYPVEKDWTDSELALQAALEDMGAGGGEVWMIGAFGDRLDHVLANMGMAATLAARGIRAWLTDGTTYLLCIKGPDDIKIDLDTLGLDDPYVSVIPSSGASLTGVTLSGLVYPLCDATLAPGSTRGVSNLVKSGCREIGIRIMSGEGYLTFLPNAVPG